VLYIVRYTNSSHKELRLIAPQKKRLPKFLLMFERRQIIDKHTELKVVICLTRTVYFALDGRIKTYWIS